MANNAEAAVREVLLEDLVKLMKSLIAASGERGKSLVEEKNLITRLFREFLFASHYSKVASEENEED